ncbi:hypothetical protein [Tepidibacter formicigenes]|uniref:SHOCT domain-containing protein n=1 Tax=Tepidibacter formicigenes DSM 15518 TaxID=1123349 RepID=A0A1M6QS63_9FIRM|nr:hypothetical protein [Tepidibacter formicigenes]SHK22857.1 hypothetical protein SAMN02744037_01933 [Tepidibacter formicigenes DSM 15518]
MKANARMKKILSGVLIGGTVLSSLGLAAFADSSDIVKMEKAPRMKNMTQYNFNNKRNNIEERINKLVEQGVITEDEASKWKELREQNQEERQAQMQKVRNMTKEERQTYFEENGMRGKNRGKGLSGLVEAGVISQERADEIQEKIHEIRVQENQQRFEERLNKLVEEGIITENEVAKWKEFHDQKVEERQAEMENIRNMTIEERKAYFEENKGEKGDRLAELVEAGVISQDQADEIKSKMPQRNEEGRGFRGGQKIKGKKF